MPETNDMETIKAALARLEAGIRRAPKTRDPDDDDPPRDRASFQARLRDVTRQRNEAETRLQEALDAAKKLEAAADARIAEIKADAARAVSAVDLQHREARALGKLDLDEHGIAEARRVYGLLPEAGRPKDVVAWWEAAKLEDLPKTLSGYKKPAEEKEPEPSAAKRQAPKVDKDRGKRPPPKDPASMTNDEYEAWLRSEREAAFAS